MTSTKSAECRELTDWRSHEPRFDSAGELEKSRGVAADPPSHFIAELGPLKSSKLSRSEFDLDRNRTLSLSLAQTPGERWVGEERRRDLHMATGEFRITVGSRIQAHVGARVITPLVKRLAASLL